MRKKISLVIWLMSLCTLFLLGLQLYWNYQSYRSNSRIFKSDINDALDKAVATQINIKRDSFTKLYEQWLADTSLITITVRYSDSVKSNIFTLKDTHPPFSDRRPFSVGINEFKRPIRQLTPAVKVNFIHHFVKNMVRNELISGSAYYYTERLGDSLVAAFNRDRLNVALLKQLYRKELSERDINSGFELHITKYTFKGFIADATTVNTGRYTTRSFKYGFSAPMLAISAYFPHPDLVFLQRMKWVLLASLVLIGITIICFTYTTKTLLSQHKLALLKDDFINNMTHELNTPLASIKITTEALKTFDHNATTQQEYLNIINYQTEKLMALTTQILNAGQLNKHIRENNAATELNGLIETAIHDMKPQSKNSGMQIRYQPGEKEIYVKGNTTSLLNTFTNIIDNALKYTAGNPRLDITLSANYNYAKIIFTDNGIGIPEEYRDKIFDKFFRVPKGNKHDVKGYGLGLSYVNQVIEQHGGTISVAENKPSGSVFTVKLPLS